MSKNSWKKKEMGRGMKKGMMRTQAICGEAMRLMEAFMGVDEELLARCEDAGREKSEAENRKWNPHVWRYLCSCAALLALFVTGAVGLREIGKVSTDGSMNMSGSVERSGDGSNPGDVNNMQEYFFDEESLEMQPPAQNADAIDGSMGAVSPSSTEKMNQQTADFTVNTEVRPGSVSEKEGQEIDSIKDLKNEEEIGSDGVENCQVNPAVQDLTEAQARQVETLSEYIPQKLPEGFTFGSAEQNPEEGRLTLTWHRGMDYIMISIRKVDGEAPETADVSKPECYDERLYEIPYGETVPREYWKTFNSPVFAKDDLSLEIVSSRVLSYNGDGGDTSTPRGNFSVLYDGVLVSFNGRGTPEQIWEMFSSIRE